MHHHTVFLSPICTILGCTPNEFWSIYDDDKVATNVLSNDILSNVIGTNHETLRAADRRYRLDDLLSGMIIYAPHPLGQRYVAVCLQIAHQKGKDAAVINLAKVWMEQPMLAISRVSIPEPSSSHTPEPEARDFKEKLAKREEYYYYCPLTGGFDRDRFQMAAAHIIPLSLNDFGGKKIGLEISDSAHTCDIFQSWTQIDLHALAGSNINSPANGIYMSNEDHQLFRQFEFYLDKDVYPTVPNKYRLRTVCSGFILTTGECEKDVEFRSLAQSGIEPPDPTFLRAHAAFAKVLRLCGAAEHFESVESDADNRGSLRENGETDVGLLLMSKLAITARTRIQV